MFFGGWGGFGQGWEGRQKRVGWGELQEEEGEEEAEEAEEDEDIMKEDELSSIGETLKVCRCLTKLLSEKLSTGMTAARDPTQICV